MLDLPRLKRIRLTAAPMAQRLLGGMVLQANYRFLPGNVQIEVEGLDRLPSEPVIFAMNHTDKYNYFPFQYYLWKNQSRFTATWVKGKYYESRSVGAFIELMNQLPTVSRGYIVTRDFVSALGRRPTDAEYEVLRHWVNETAAERSIDHGTSAMPSLQPLLSTPRDMLGRAFDPARETYGQAVNQTYGAMMREFVGLHEKAFACNLDLLIFPQGTRSVQLTRGRIGLSQVALRYRKTVVPVGCSGSDRLYPSESPWAKPGRVVYRIGDPIPYGTVPNCMISEPFEPFTPSAEHQHRDVFQRHIDYVMDRINELVDPEYQYGADPDATELAGTERFL
jgi:1-acyl-sn-glycerol-3-phosphate acyltransferase